MIKNTAFIPHQPLNRQEASAYVLLAAITVFVLVAGGLLFWTLSPLATVPSRVLIGQTADFPIASTPYLVQLELRQNQIEAFTAVDPQHYPSIWLVHSETGWLALNRYTPPFGSSKTRSCLYVWTPTNGRFEDPCYGSKFTLDGRLIQPPASHNLTTFPILIKGDKIWLDLAHPIPGAAAEPLCRRDNSCL